MYARARVRFCAFVNVMGVCVCPGQQKQVDPELFRVFYTFWKETEAEAQEVALPAGVVEQLEASECVFKLSSSVKTSRGVGQIAMTQRRLFLLTGGRPGFLEITKFRDIEVRGPAGTTSCVVFLCGSLRVCV